jgi:type I restriction enzyme S subunit
MSEWQECKLGDVAIISGGKRLPKGKMLTLIPTRHPYIRITDFSGHKILLNDIQYVDDEIQNTISRYIVNSDDLIISIVGTLGLCAIVPKELDKANLTENCAKIQIKENAADKLFLYYKLISKDTQDLISGFDVGSTQPKLPLYNIQTIDILLPPLAAVLSNLDDKIDLLNRQNKTLGGLAATLWRKMFIQDADPNWEVINFEDFFDFLEGPGIRNWQYTLTGTRFINIRLINNGEIDTSKASFVSNEEANTKYEHFLLKEDDMIVSTSGTLGKTAIVRDYHLPLMLNTSVIRFRPKDGISHAFLYQYLNSAQFQNHLEAVATGSVQSNFGPVHLKQMKLNRPPENILQNYLNKADNFYKKIKLNSLQIRTLSILRDGLLPKLMSGEVRVKV